MAPLKTLSILSFLFLFATACTKDKPIKYERTYTVGYYQVTDSYTAVAAFREAYEPVKLRKNESVLFNGRELDRASDFYGAFVYRWDGKGRVDANFSFKNSQGIFNTSISESELFRCELSVPDTISKSKGFILLAKGYKQTKPNYGNLVINSESIGKTITLKSDSSFISPETLDGFEEGKVQIQLVDYAEQRTETTANSGPERIIYKIFIDSETYLTK